MREIVIIAVNSEGRLRKLSARGRRVFQSRRSKSSITCDARFVRTFLMKAETVYRTILGDVIN